MNVILSESAPALRARVEGSALIKSESAPALRARVEGSTLIKSDSVPRVARSRRRICIAGIAAFLLFALFSVAAECPNRNQLKSQESLLRMEDYWVQALTSRDSGQIDCLLAPDFADSDWKGERLNREQVLAAVVKRSPVPAGVEHHFEDMKARIVGNLGIINGVSYWSYADGSRHNVARFTDIFEYRNSRWLAIAGQETAVENPQQ
jgi:hypothetical protein